MVAYTEIAFGDPARTALLAATAALADAVRPTLGPQSHAVLIEKKWGTPLVCDDGVTIARTLKLENAVSVAGVLLLAAATMVEREDAPRAEVSEHEHA